MKQLLAAAAIVGLTSAASPCWAQANGGANPCLGNVNVELHANGLVFGGGGSTNLPVKDDDCWRLQRAQFAGLVAANIHDPAESKAWLQAARAVWCSISDNSKAATELCGSPPTVSVATVPPLAPAPGPSPHIDASPVVATLSVAPQHASPPRVASVSSGQPWYSSCPAGVPISECYR